jgi:anti-sigma regulatory factor (Ser/Thr protein kinase)
VEVRAWAEAVAEGLGADRPATLRLVLILEELFTNTVVHGYPADADGPIWVTLAGGAGVIEVTYEDAGRPFDPITERQVPRVDEVPGGLGLALVRGLSIGACYARIGERNRITLGVSFGGTPPAGAG